jgi:DNA-binding SARP family transcriptional activator
MLKHHVQENPDESILGNLLTLVLLIILIGGGGAFLYVVSGPPHLPSPIPSWDEIAFTLRGSEVPLGALIYVTTTLGWLLLGYMATSILLRVVVDLLGAIAREHPLTRTLQVVSDGVTIPVVRRIVDGVLVAVLVARLLGPDVGPASAAAAPIEAVQVLPHPNGVTVAPSALSEHPVQVVDETPSLHYLVKRGDTLRSISTRFLGDEMKWPLIWEANRGRTMYAGEVFTNPDLIEPSWELTIPVPDQPTHAVYVVQPGDALWSIAERELGDGMKWREIWALNEGRVMDDGLPFSDPRLIEPGWRILLPKPPTPVVHQTPPVPRPQHPSAAGSPPPELDHPFPGAPPVVPQVGSPPIASVPPPLTAVTAVPSAGPAPAPTPARATSATKVSPTVTLPDGRIVAASFGAALLGLLGYLGRRKLGALVATSPDDGRAYTPGRFLAALRQRFAAELETDKVAILANRLVALLGAWGEPGAIVVSCLEGRKSVAFTLRCDPEQARRLEELEPIIRAELHARTRVEATERGDVTIALSGLSLQGMVASARLDQDDALPLLVPIGATADNRVLHLNLADAGALLIAGLPGGGAHELLRDLTVILAAQAHPRQLTLDLFGDPRGVLESLTGLPHLDGPIGDPSDPTAVQTALSALQAELGRRIGLCQAKQAPTIDAYNVDRADAVAPLPYLVVGLAGLEEILSCPGAAGVLATLGHDGPAYGIVVVAASSAIETLPEPVLNAFPTRLALRLLDESQSLRVLGQPGAEGLGPEGELLLRPRGDLPARLRGLRIEPDEVAECVALMTAALGGVAVSPDASATGAAGAAITDDRSVRPEVDSDTVRSNGNVTVGDPMALVDPRAAIILDEQASDNEIPPDVPLAGARSSPPPSSSTNDTHHVDDLIDLPLTEEGARSAGLLTVYTLGRYRVFRGETEINGATAVKGTGAKSKTAFRAKARELLAYFVTHRARDLTRERIQEDLWPEAEPTQSQQVFHNTLWVVRSALNALGESKEKTNFIVEQDGAYHLANELVWLDAREFDACVEHAEELAETAPERAALLWERAVGLYQGDYLDSAYAEWASAEQMRLRQMYLRALRKLADSHVARRQLDRAIVFLVKAVALEPFEEALQRKLLHLYAATSDWQALIRQYERLEEMLRREMHVAPDRKTRELYQRLMANRNAPTGQPAA